MAAVTDVQKCAFCRTRPVEAPWRPFCSERCKLQDLARWADGAYRVPAEPVSEPDESDISHRADKSSQ